MPGCNWQKIKQMLSNVCEGELLLFENYSHFSTKLSSKNKNVYTRIFIYQNISHNCFYNLTTDVFHMTVTQWNLKTSYHACMFLRLYEWWDIQRFHRTYIEVENYRMSQECTNKIKLKIITILMSQVSYLLTTPFR